MPRPSIESLFLFACAAAALSAFDSHAQAETFTYRGVAYVSYQPDEYATTGSTASIADLSSTGANWASLLGTWYMAAPSSTSIAPEALNSPTDAAVIQAISDMHANNLHVMLKPQVDVDDGSWRGQITPSDTNAWFASYTTFITHYASIAQAQNVELFCIGCELKTLSGASYKLQWQSVIQAVRAVYSGPLTYAANAYAAGDEYANVSFWPQVDIAGLDCYSPLTNHADPTIAELVAAWSHDLAGQNLVTAFTNFQAALNMPVMFTEMGYQSAQGTNMSPNYTPPTTVDQQEQANCYEAALEVWTAQPWCRGIFWWGWEPSIPPAGDQYFTARGKLAETVLKNWYTALNSPPSFTSAINATPAAPNVGDTVTFTGTATDTDSDFVLYTWDFGDSSTGSGSSTTHAYSTAGTFTVTLTASDGKGGSVSETAKIVVASTSTGTGTGTGTSTGTATGTNTGTGTGSGTGVATGTDTNTGTDTSTTTGTGGGGGTTTTTPFKLLRVAIHLDFAHTNKDSMQLSGILPLSAPVTFEGSTLLLNAGCVIRTWQPDKNGALPKSSNDTFKLSKPRKGSAPFMLKLNKDSFAAALATWGFTGTSTVKKQSIAFTVSLVVNNVTYQATRTVKYSAVKGKTGSAQ